MKVTHLPAFFVPLLPLLKLPRNNILAKFLKEQLLGTEWAMLIAFYNSCRFLKFKRHEITVEGKNKRGHDVTAHSLHGAFARATTPAARLRLTIREAAKMTLSVSSPRPCARSNHGPCSKCRKEFLVYSDCNTEIRPRKRKRHNIRTWPA